MYIKYNFWIFVTKICMNYFFYIEKKLIKTDLNCITLCRNFILLKLKFFTHIFSFSMMRDLIIIFFVSFPSYFFQIRHAQNLWSSNTISFYASNYASVSRHCFKDTIFTHWHIIFHSRLLCKERRRLKSSQIIIQIWHQYSLSHIVAPVIVHSSRGYGRYK